MTSYELLNSWITSNNEFCRTDCQRFEKSLTELLSRQSKLMLRDAKKDPASKLREEFNRCPAKVLYELFFMPLSNCRERIINPDGLLKTDNTYFKLKSKKSQNKTVDFIKADRAKLTQVLIKMLEAEIGKDVCQYFIEIGAMVYKNGAKKGKRDNQYIRISLTALEEELNTHRHPGLNLQQLPPERCYWLEDDSDQTNGSTAATINKQVEPVDPKPTVPAATAATRPKEPMQPQRDGSRYAKQEGVQNEARISVNNNTSKDGQDPSASTGIVKTTWLNNANEPIGKLDKHGNIKPIIRKKRH